MCAWFANSSPTTDLCGPNLDSSADKSLTDADAEVAQNPAVIFLNNTVAAEKIEASLLQIIQTALPSIGHTYPDAHRPRPWLLAGPLAHSSAPAASIHSR